MTMRRLLPALLVALLALGLMAPSSTAAPDNPSNDFVRMPRECAKPKDKIPPKPVICEITRYDKSRPTVVLWGDSHAWMFIPSLKNAVKGRDVNLLALVMGSCPPVDENLTKAEQQNAQACKKNNVNGLNLVKNLKRKGQPFRVVLSTSWQRYYAAIKAGDKKSYIGQTAHRMNTGTPRLIRTLTDMGVGVDVIGQAATVPGKTANCRKGNDPYACDVKRSKALKTEGAVRKWILRMMQPLPGNPKPINVNNTFCTAKVCHGTKNGIRTWFDDLHLSATNAARLDGFFTPTVNKIAATDPTEPTDPGDGGGGGDDSPLCQILPILC